MSAPKDGSHGSGGWVALEDASSVFERPSWAIRALVDQGKLERKVEDGCVYVRMPPSSPPASVRTPVRTPVRDPNADEPKVDASLDALVAELESLGVDVQVSEPEPPAELALRAAIAPQAAPLLDPRDSALFRELAADLADLAHATRSRDQLLARAAQALRAVEASRAPVEPPKVRRAPWALAGVLAVLAAVAFLGARFEAESADAARAEAEISLRRASVLEAHAARERKQTAALAAAFLPASIAASSSGSLPAGFAK